MVKEIGERGVRVYVSNFGTHRVEDGDMTLEQFLYLVERVFVIGGDPSAEVFYAAPGEFLLASDPPPPSWLHRCRAKLAEWIAPDV